MAESLKFKNGKQVLTCWVNCLAAGRYFSLKMLAISRNQPGCEAKIRGIASALAFCLENSVDAVEEIGNVSGSAAAAVLCSTFGREEGDSQFKFTQRHIDVLVTR